MGEHAKTCPECGEAIQSRPHAEKHALRHWPLPDKFPLRTGSKSTALFHVRRNHLLGLEQPSTDKLDAVAREELRRLTGAKEA